MVCFIELLGFLVYIKITIFVVKHKILMNNSLTLVNESSCELIAIFKVGTRFHLDKLNPWALDSEAEIEDGVQCS